MISCIIVDDEPLALEQLKQYTSKSEILDLKGSFVSAIEALDFLRSNPVDLLFLDINMPEISGVELAEAMPSTSKVVFITAYREYALEGFKIDAADYLLKPISYAVFIKSVEKVASRYFSSRFATQDDVMKEPCSTTTKDFIFVRSEYKQVRVNLSEIKYIESEKEYISIMLDSGESVKTYGSLNNMTEKLPADKFMRVHRSFIVNLDKVNVVERNSIVFGRLHIPVNDQAKDKFQQFIDGV